MKNILLSFLALSLAASFSTDSSAQFYVYKGGEAVYTLKNSLPDSVSLVAPTSETAKMMYLIGSSIGDGSWDNTNASVGVSLVPMSVMSGAEYNAQGEGSLVFNGYFVADGVGFKIITTPGYWTEQWGVVDGSYAYQDTGAENITVSSDGYYSVVLNTTSTSSDAIAIYPFSTTPTVYSQVCLAGDFNSWDDFNLSPVSTAYGMSGHNHLWKTTITIPEGGSAAKFKIAGDWNVNWGSDAFPYGVGVHNGYNLNIPEGTWLVIFNDIDGSYSFFAQ